MVRKVIALILSAGICLLSALPSSAASLRLETPVKLLRFFTYNGSGQSYVYGCRGKTIVSAQVLPRQRTVSVTADGDIHSVSHDDSAVYGLYRNSSNRYAVISMSLSTGKVSRCELDKYTNISANIFAAANGHAFVADTARLNTRINEYDGSGKRVRTYTMSRDAKELFVSDNRVYCTSYDGKLYRLDGSPVFVAEFPTYLSVKSVSCDAVYADNNTLISLDSGEKETVARKPLYAVRTDSCTFAASEAIMACGDQTWQLSAVPKQLVAVGYQAAVIYDDLNCELFTIPQEETTAQPTTAQSDAQDRQGNPTLQTQPTAAAAQPTAAATQPPKNPYNVSGSAVSGIAPQTAITTFCNNYPGKVTVAHSSRSVTSGIICTGDIVTGADGTLTAYVLGDLTGNGRMSEKDIHLMMHSLIDASGLDPLTLSYCADFDYNGTVNTRDLLLAAKKYR